jgi:hypothetical protein
MSETDMENTDTNNDEANAEAGLKTNTHDEEGTTDLTNTEESSGITPGTGTNTDTTNTSATGSGTGTGATCPLQAPRRILLRSRLTGRLFAACGGGDGLTDTTNTGLTDTTNTGLTDNTGLNTGSTDATGINTAFNTDTTGFGDDPLAGLGGSSSQFGATDDPFANLLGNGNTGFCTVAPRIVRYRTRAGGLSHAILDPCGGTADTGFGGLTDNTGFGGLGDNTGFGDTGYSPVDYGNYGDTGGGLNYGAGEDTSFNEEDQ